MTNKIIQALDKEQLKTDVPEFSPGDTIVVQVKVKEGTRERLQAFEGVVIAKRNRGINSASVYYTPLRPHETGRNLLSRLLLEKKKLLLFIPLFSPPPL